VSESEEGRKGREREREDHNPIEPQREREDE
jgi:hypothetical protein